MLGQPPPGWTRLDADQKGVPVWRRDGGTVCVATHDMDQLLFLAVALTRFDRMTTEEFERFVVH